MKNCDIRKVNYFSLLKFIVTFFVIATKKVTKEKSRHTRSLRAFCLAGATPFVLYLNPLHLILFAALREIFKYYKKLDLIFVKYSNHSSKTTRAQYANFIL
jgi:hypothetical protein